jgi:hypothetical protein
MLRLALLALKTFRLEPGLIHGRHYKRNETTLRQNLENHLAARVSTVLRTSTTPDAIVTYSLRANEDKDSRKREITRYSLEIRITDTARNTSGATSSVPSRSPSANTAKPNSGSKPRAGESESAHPPPDPRP